MFYGSKISSLLFFTGPTCFLSFVLGPALPCSYALWISTLLDTEGILNKYTYSNSLLTCGSPFIAMQKEIADKTYEWRAWQTINMLRKKSKRDRLELKTELRKSLLTYWTYWPERKETHYGYIWGEYVPKKRGHQVWGLKRKAFGLSRKSQKP